MAPRSDVLTGGRAVGRGGVKYMGFTASTTEPTIALYPENKAWGWHRNTAKGTIYIAYNDGGIIKKIFTGIVSPDWANPKNYGAIGDGTTHTITSGDVTAHPEWVGTYTAGTDTWDYVGIQEAIYAAFYSGTTTPNENNTYLNKPLYIPEGNYLVNKAPTILKLKGGMVMGAGRRATTITSTADVPALQLNGAWYTRFVGLQFFANSARTFGVVEIDGNYDGTNTQGVQGLSWYDCFFHGNDLATYCTAICRQGGSGAQGSEISFYSCHWQNPIEAGYFQTGFNAVQNAIYGGNFQGHPKYGVFLNAGQIGIYQVGFQSTYAYTQITNGGYDIDCSSAGTADRIIVDGCRTESLRFYNGAASQYAYIRGCTQAPSIFEWSAAATVPLHSAVLKVATDGKRRLYECTTAGVTGGAEPAWPTTGTVADNTVTWTQRNFTAIAILSGRWEDINFPSSLSLSTNSFPQNPTREVTANYTVTLNDEMLLVDTSGGAVTITIPNAAPQDCYVPGKRYIIKKYTTDANTVTLHAAGNAINLAADWVVAGGSRGYVVVEHAGGGGLSGAFWVVANG